MGLRTINTDFLNVIQNHYFELKGRVRRDDFWTFVLACFVIFVVIGILGGLFLPNRVDSIIGALLVLALMPPLAGMGARRLHDAGKSGLLVWPLVIPMVLLQIDTLLSTLTNPYGPAYYIYFPTLLIQVILFFALIALVYFWVQDGTPGPNKYGADTKVRTKR